MFAYKMLTNRSTRNLPRVRFFAILKILWAWQIRLAQVVALLKNGPMIFNKLKSVLRKSNYYWQRAGLKR